MLEAPRSASNLAVLLDKENRGEEVRSMINASLLSSGALWVLHSRRYSRVV